MESVCLPPVASPRFPKIRTKKRESGRGMTDKRRDRNAFDEGEEEVKGTREGNKEMEL